MAHSDEPTKERLIMDIYRSGQDYGKVTRESEIVYNYQIQGVLITLEDTEDGRIQKPKGKIYSCGYRIQCPRERCCLRGIHPIRRERREYKYFDDSLSPSSCEGKGAHSFSQ